jgi:hypothetical protein
VLVVELVDVVDVELLLVDVLDVEDVLLVEEVLDVVEVLLVDVVELLVVLVELLVDVDDDDVVVELELVDEVDVLVLVVVVVVGGKSEPSLPLRFTAVRSCAKFALVVVPPATTSSLASTATDDAQSVKPWAPFRTYCQRSSPVAPSSFAMK